MKPFAVFLLVLFSLSPPTLFAQDASGQQPKDKDADKKQAASSSSTKKDQKKDEPTKRNVQSEQVKLVETPQAAPLVSKKSGLMGAVNKWLKTPGQSTLQSVLADKITPQKMEEVPPEAVFVNQVPAQNGP